MIVLKEGVGNLTVAAYEHEYGGGPSETVNTKETINKFYDF